ncbi:MAG: hypothetical protein KIS76_03990 [Pyrinomonadaceae bacterium]|nr:hypothetical protein [Pyrinomonadaceae bacterium]
MPNYIVEKTVESFKVLEALDHKPASLPEIVSRVGVVPGLNRRLKTDAVRRILITLEALGYARVEQKSKFWRRGYKTL